MTKGRRIGAEDSETRAALLDAAQHLMLEEGYAAVSSRRVAKQAGLKPQLVHYYFRTMDDLFVALVRRGAERNLERQARALASPQPLRALWAFTSDRAGTELTMEFSALANHRKAIRAELLEYAEHFRMLQIEAMEAVLERHGVENDEFPLEALVVLLTGVSQTLVMEEALGLTIGHAKMRGLVERFLAHYEGSENEGEEVIEEDAIPEPPRTASSHTSGGRMRGPADGIGKRTTGKNLPKRE